MVTRARKAARSGAAGSGSKGGGGADGGDRVGDRGAQIHGRGADFHITAVQAAGASRVLNVLPDLPDMRDRYYEPTLAMLKSALEPQPARIVRDQGSEGACTGFALAAIVDILAARRATAETPAQPVSPRMLYEMARLHDEWPGIDYNGSSIRGAVKGFYHNGVCSEASAPYVPNDTGWTLTLERAKEARVVRLGAYYRLRRDITDFHAALNEVGAVFVSARIHDGWENATGKTEIPPGGAPKGGHAFTIVGYDHLGFIVQNSWGKTWGVDGIARWTYADWAATLVDAWVLQLAVPAPAAFDLQRTSLTTQARSGARISDLRRAEIIGHFINIDDGNLQDKGKYATPLTSVLQTRDRIAKETEASPADRKYDHLVIYAHGGLNSLDAEAARIDRMAPVFKRNKIYNYHLMWGTSAFEVLWDAIAGKGRQRDDRMGSVVSDLADALFESIAGSTGSLIWRQIKDDARASFASVGGGTKGLGPIIEAANGGARPLKIHLVGHSAGAIILGHLIDLLTAGSKRVVLDSVHLMAPACTADFFNARYGPQIGAAGGKTSIGRLFVYNMTDEREQDDEVGLSLLGTTIPVYFKSLLYLVSNAFETERASKLAGMARFAARLQPAPTEIALAGRAADRKKSDSSSHGGFDNDVATMNTILERVLGHKPPLPFEPKELTGF